MFLLFACFELRIFIELLVGSWQMPLPLYVNLEDLNSLKCLLSVKKGRRNGEKSEVSS